MLPSRGRLIATAGLPLDGCRSYCAAEIFRPAPGPRQMPAEANADPTRSPRKLLLTASFLTQPAALEKLLPERFALAGEPVVPVEFHHMTEIDWLAGRGYTMVHVWWPAVFTGERDRASGRFLAVMWENLADPIISGREEIGHPKLFAEIPEVRISQGAHHCSAAWMGYRFLELEVSALADGDAPGALPPASDGTLMLKYMPRTGDWGKADVCQVTLTPASASGVTVERRQRGKGIVKFYRAAWADLPTMFHVVNALTGLPVLESRGGTVALSRGGKPCFDQKVLE
jgi:acetoacetate decarboxylase